MFTDRNGRASDDSLVAAMFRLMPESPEETVMFTNEDEGFQELFDRLLACSSTKQSIQMSVSERPTRKDDPMKVDALSKGLRKRKIERKRQEGQRPKPHEQRQVLELRQVWAVIWWSRDQGKSKSKGKGKLNNAESSNWQEGWLEGKPQSYREKDEEHVDGWWKTTD